MIFKLKKISWHEIKSAAVYVTPHLPMMQTKRYKFSLLSAFLWVTLFVFVNWFLLIIILGITPLKDYVFAIDNEAVLEQSAKIDELEKKVRFLRSEIESIVSKQRKLKYALVLGGADSLISGDKKAVKEKLLDTLKKAKPIKKIKEGNVLVGLYTFIYNLFYKDNNNPVFVPPSLGIVIKEFNPEKGHFGVDYGIKSGTPVYAVSGGLVLFAGFTADDGNTIIIQHGNKYISIYKHLSVLIKKQRDRVEIGETIALSGNSGYNSTGSHLHLEIWYNGKPIDPKTVIIRN
ncbi:MAG TPA: M23 family metallopeptidase [Melioribacteraceae bacterium]|nr:M23 family metallopeptidase [Melioribacteraceae bacterium]